MPFDPNTPRSRDEVLLQAIVSGDSSAMGDPRDREEEFVKAIADKETLPDYSEASEGDVLQIGTDGPEWGAVPNELPAIAAGDAGKVLKVNSGETGTEWDAIPTPTVPKKYLHYLYVYTSGTYIFTALYIDDKSSIVKKDFFEYIYNNGFTAITNFYPGVTGAFCVSSAISRIWCGAYSSNGVACSGVYIKNDGTLDDFSIASATFTIKTLEI